MTTDFPIRIGRRSRLFLRFVFGVRPGHDLVRLGDGVVDIRFGWFNPRIPVDEVERWRIEGPWRWFTAIGVRMNVLKRDLSFCGSPRGGVRMDLRAPFRYGPLADPDGLRGGRGPGGVRGRAGRARDPRRGRADGARLGAQRPRCCQDLPSVATDGA